MRATLIHRFGQHHSPFDVKMLTRRTFSGVSQAIVTSQVQVEAEAMFAEAFTWFYVRPDGAWRMNSVRWWQ